MGGTYGGGPERKETVQIAPPAPLHTTPPGDMVSPTNMIAIEKKVGQSISCLRAARRLARLTGLHALDQDLQELEERYLMIQGSLWQLAARPR